ncbi:MAG TPA: hypothetical protein VGF94_28445 [Kofleriaceae bacterium]
MAAATLGLSVLHACGTSPVPPSPDGGDLGGGGGHPLDARATAGGADGGSGGQSQCVASGTTTTIGDNHGHVLVVSSGDVAAGAAKSYNIQGTSDHNHTVALTAAEFAMLQQDSAVMTTSSFDDGHDHSILVACA